MKTVMYRYLAMERVVFGEPAAAAAVAEIERLGRRRVFVVTSRSVAAGVPFAAIVAALGDRCVGRFTEINAHGPREDVVAAAVAARAADADLLLAVGGGSAIDSAKVILLCLRHGITQPAELDPYRGFSTKEPSLRPADEAQWRRMVAVPTTLSAAEFTWFGGALDTGRRVKEAYRYPLMVPQAVILDPAITLATPLSLFLSTGMKAIDHAAEHLASLRSEPLNDALAMQSLRLLSRGLQRVRENPEDLQARLDCQMGMALGMTGPNSGAGVGASHAVGHALGGNNGVAHGETSCVLLPAVMRWNLPANPYRQKLISQALGRPDLEAAVALAELINSLGLPRNLREVGVGRESFSAIASRVMDDFAIRSNPRPVTTPEEVVEILELAW